MHSSGVPCYLPMFSDCKKGSGPGLWKLRNGSSENLSRRSKINGALWPAPFSVPLGLVFQDICFGWVTMVLWSFIRGSFCLMNGKRWEIVKTSKSTCRVKWAVLMSPRKAWVVQEAAWHSSVSSGFRPCLLMVKSLSTFFLLWKRNMSCSLHSVNIAVRSRLSGCPPQPFQPHHCSQPQGVAEYD